MQKKFRLYVRLVSGFDEQTDRFSRCTIEGRSFDRRYEEIISAVLCCNVRGLPRCCERRRWDERSTRSPSQDEGE